MTKLELPQKWPPAARGGRAEAIYRSIFEAVVEHRLPPEKPLPDWYARDRDRLFALAEAPLASLSPNEEPPARKLRARTLFSAVHGVVLLGLEEKLAPTSSRTLEAQLREFVATMARGLREN